jgi:hypothetical protein
MQHRRLTPTERLPKTPLSALGVKIHWGHGGKSASLPRCSSQLSEFIATAKGQGTEDFVPFSTVAILRLSAALVRFTLHLLHLYPFVRLVAHQPVYTHGPVHAHFIRRARRCSEVKATKLYCDTNARG